MNQLASILLALIFVACSHQERKISSVSDEVKQGTGITCRLSKVFKQSERHDCIVEKTKKAFHVLKLKGAYTENTYAHGYLLAQEMNDGVLKEVVETFQKSLQAMKHPTREIIGKLQQCFLKRVRMSSSEEFRFGGDQLYKGYIAGLKEKGLQPVATEADLQLAYYGIELGNVVNGLLWQLEHKKGAALSQVFGDCGVSFFKGLGKGLLEVFQDKQKMEMGCIGFVAPAAITKDHVMMHARNLDTNNLDGWHVAPVMILNEEPGYHKFVSAATAGLTYAGGISGFNDQGISVSLHQMDSPNYEANYKKNSAEIMPFLQQRILREAASIDEALDIISKVKRFASWTIFISDSKSDEVASIEISADKFQVARRRQSQFMGQSNHFIGDEMQEQFFKTRYGHHLESDSRILGIEQKLTKSAKYREIDLEWMLNHQAGHEDFYEGKRSFGRTAVKAINTYATVAIPAKKEFWVTASDAAPAIHGSILGFKIDFEKLDFQPLYTMKTSNLSDMPNWEKSFGEYVMAMRHFNHGDLAKSKDSLTSAIKLAEKDKFFDVSYYMVRARVQYELKEFTGASADYHELWDRREGMHKYTQALIAYHSVASSDQSPVGQQISKEERELRLQIADDILASLLEELKEHNPDHYKSHGGFDLMKKISIVKDLKKGKIPKLQSIGFTLAE